MRLPVVIQGGMGVAISHWPLAKAVSTLGQLGVVSGAGIDIVLCHRLAEGDLNGDVRRALSHFPFPNVADQILQEYLLRRRDSPRAKATNRLPIWTANPTIQRIRLGVLGGFVEAYLAKEGHMTTRLESISSRRRSLPTYRCFTARCSPVSTLSSSVRVCRSSSPESLTRSPGI